MRDGDADAVVVGFHRDFDYERLRIAARAVRRGARLLATNDDSSYPTPDGPIPGGGAILAAVVDRDGRRCRWWPASRTRRWPTWCAPGSATTGVMVGDRPDTDGRFARALGYRFALVHTGRHPGRASPVDPSPTWWRPTCWPWSTSSRC